MTNTLLQLSHKPALRLHARVVADVQVAAAPLGVRLMRPSSGRSSGRRLATW